VNSKASGDEDSILAACVQMRVGPDKERNLRTAFHWVRTAAEQGARLVVLPELFSWRGTPAASAAAAESLEGRTVDALAHLAAETQVTLVAGSLLEAAGPDQALPFNTTVVFGPDGAQLGLYRKMHLFDLDVPGGPVEKESERFQAGDQPVCVSTPVGKIGLSICYDLRFPELYRELVRAGAEILVAPAAFTAHTGAAHWEVLLRARAIENQCWVLAAAQAGPVASGTEVWGHSAVIDPWGSILDLRAGGEGLASAVLDRAFAREVRTQLPCLQNRRISL
jgi:predicted amidohydrolase